MIRHFFIDKSNSIIEGSLQNVGLNPVLHVGYGPKIMRGILEFDLCPIKELIDDKTFADTDKLSISLKMTNCFSIDGIPYEKELFTATDNKIMRAASFDLMLFKMPCSWDAGRGFDFVSDFWIRNNRSYSQEGSSWYFAKSGLLWPYEAELADLNNPDLDWADLKRNVFGAKGGIYPFEVLVEEYKKYLDGEKSIIVGTQHFDFGNENLSIDVTAFVKEAIETGVNNGLCLAFTPDYETMKTDIEQYVGFVTDKTNTFFHPYLEVIYDNYINDDRESFTIGRENNLCLYVAENGEPVNLDELPLCNVNGIETEAEQVTKGVYKVTVPANTPLKNNAIYYDNWFQLSLDGQELEDVEMEFATNPISRKLKIGNDSNIRADYIPSLYGINDDEKIGRGEVREVTVELLKKYETNVKELFDSAMYRLYVLDGNREIDVIPYHPVEKAYLNNFFMVYTEDLIPGEYFVDIRLKIGRETKYFKRALKFTVVSNVTERYN